MTLGWYFAWFILPFSKAGVEIGACLAIACWLVYRWVSVRREGWWRWTERLEPVRWPLVWFLVICAVTIVTGVRPEQSLRAFWRKTLEYAAMFIITTDVVRTRRRLWWVVALFLISGPVMGADAIYQHMTRHDWIKGHPIMAERVTGPFEMPSDFGAYLITVTPMVITVALTRVRALLPRRWGGDAVGVAAGRVLRLGGWGVVIGLLLWSLAESVSRGAWFALAVVALVLAAIRSRRLLAAACIGLLLLAWVLPESLTAHLVEAVTVGDAASRQRVEMWAITWQMIRDRPLIGHGLGVYMWNLGRYGITPDNVLMINYAHNCYLQLWAEVGIFGLAAFLWLAGVVLWLGVTRWLAERDPFLRAMALGLIAGLSALLIHSGVDTDLYSLQLATMGWVMMGLTCATARHRPAPSS